MCFFFQAEDGIRDRDVTGVQTCALPILLGFVIREDSGVIFTINLSDKTQYKRLAPGEKSLANATNIAIGDVGQGDRVRSEERRVGKECRSRWSRDTEKRKRQKERTVEGS